MSHLWSFIALVAVLVAIPGPAVTLIMKNAVIRGSRVAFLTAAGILVADLVWVLASLVGLTAVLVASEPAFLAVKLLGAAYLAYLGVRLLLSRHDTPATTPDAAIASAATGGIKAFREGVICDLSNPKTVLVFASVIPQFLPAGHTFADAAILGVTFALVGFTSLAVYALVFSHVRYALNRPRLRKMLLRASGGILIAFGVGLAVESR
ncbi:LysE family translocator [Pseudonocardia asaccharolytica]|uniref:Lysine transporter LysE n=1 Tax=Pseudonocardia asaccharolytica DSM 44247 = NBRC 16224 TaxID=1123024 RepID=A0A511D2Y0_9PSEU|nr:LysE family translocator [Pseudonocardia asaccharolytica]GEL19142.1 lysine transporter LysE [Pseudonocardia asaccharolytica DSM 44247 = NBRC 16224]